MTVALTRSIGAFVEGLAFEHVPPAAVAIMLNSARLLRRT